MEVRSPFSGLPPSPVPLGLPAPSDDHPALVTAHHEPLRRRLAAGSLASRPPSSSPSFSCLGLFISLLLSHNQGFPGGSVVKSLPAMQQKRVLFLRQEGPPEQGMATHTSVPAREIS